jgi:hypothetical protein
MECQVRVFEPNTKFLDFSEMLRCFTFVKYESQCINKAPILARIDLNEMAAFRGLQTSGVCPKRHLNELLRLRLNSQAQMI